MIERISILTLMQLSNKMRLKIDNKKRFAGVIGIRILIIVLMSVVMSLLLHVIKNILYIPVNAHFIIFILLLTQGLSILAATSGLVTDLYHSKDNHILLSFPAKNNEVFISKIVVFYIQELLRNLYLLIPVLIAFGQVNQQTLLYFINIIPMVFLLPLLSVLIASILSIPWVFIKNYLKKHHLISLVLFLALIAGLFYLSTSIISQIPLPIRIVQLYNRFIISLTLFMQNSASYGTIYTVIGQLLYGIQPFINYVIIISTLLVLSALVVFISRPLYLRFASESLENAITKPHKKPNKESRNLFFTFLKKEWLISLRSMNELLSNYAILLSLPFFMYFLNYVYMGMNRSTLGNQLVIVFNVMITLLLVTASNTASSTAITIEGSEFVLLKTAPSNTSQVAWAKMTFNIIFSTTVILISFLLFQWALPVFPVQNIWLLFLLVILINSGHILWSFQIDILSPKLSDYASTGSLSGNKNITKSIAIGFMLSLLFTALSALLFIFLRDVAWLVILIVASAFLLVRLYFFNSYLKAFFIDIEFEGAME